MYLGIACDMFVKIGYNVDIHMGHDMKGEKYEQDISSRG